MASQPTRRRLLQGLALSLAAVAVPGCSRRRLDEAEVCVVGSGPAGAVLALELATRGIHTLLIEGGAFPSTQIGPVADTFPIARTEPMQYPIDTTRFLGSGGTSNLWNARCPRFQPFDFEAANPSMPPEAPWPLTYTELEPFYERAEQTLGVTGGPATKYSPPRRLPLPIRGVDAAPCLSAWLDSAGWPVEAPPVAQAARMAQSHVPAFASRSAARLQNDSRVIAIDVDSDGRCSGLQLRRGSDTTTVRGRFYVLACGGIETPRLLLHSRSNAFPSGLGNRSDQVGRHFMEHLGVEVGTIRLASSARCSAAEIEERVSWQLYDELKKEKLGGAILEFMYMPKESAIRVGAVIEMKPRATNRVTLSSTSRDVHGAPAAQLSIALTEDEPKAWRRVQAAGRRVADKLTGARFVAGPPEAGWCHHHMGACRMGLNPATSVVNRDLRLHEVDNLYVAGSSSFVTGGVGSPTLLLTALSIRLADHLASRIRLPQ